MFHHILQISVIPLVALFLLGCKQPQQNQSQTPQAATTMSADSISKWIDRSKSITQLFHRVYTPAWEGANGAIGDAYLFAATGDSSLLNFHLFQYDLRNINNGTWVDDRAWACLAELTWWRVTGRKKTELIESARRRYLEARIEGRLSNHEGFWSWYNYPPNARVNEPIFTNSNMNQMVIVACWLFEATMEKQFLDDALLIWKGDNKYPGVEKTFYRGNGSWEGKTGLAAFGKQLPWEGTEYCAILGALYRVTKDSKYRDIIIATARRILDPKTGWIDSTDYYQIRMDGNGAFVHYLMEAYDIAPTELSEIPGKVERMLEHVWSNHQSRATVVLHRTYDHGIRNGWNPHGGEDGYGVDEVGTVHAQSQAVRAFGVFAFYRLTHRHFYDGAPLSH